MTNDLQDIAAALRVADAVTTLDGRGGRFHLYLELPKRHKCAVPFTHRRRNVVYYIAADRFEARAWAMLATLAGYRVEHTYAAPIRERRRTSANGI